jgi:type I restriction enzyme S subunit
MNAQQLKNAILQEAIEGRLVPQDPNDEPASALLARIRKEKEQLVKEGKLKKKDLEVKPISEDEIPFEIPESWEWVRLKDIVMFIGGYAYDSTSFIPSSNNQVLRLGNVKNDNILLNVNPVFIDDKLALDTEKFRCKENDILITMTGTRKKRDYFFSVLVNSSHQNLYINQRVGCLRSIEENIAKWLVIALKTEVILTDVFQYETGTANQGNLGAENILKTKIPLPPLAEQHRIVAKIEELLPKVEEYGKAQDALNKLNLELPERLKKSILQEAIEGRLVPQDPNDEPASVLLAKIRKKKEQLVKAGKLKKKDLEETPISEDEIPFKIPESWEWCKIENITVSIGNKTNQIQTKEIQNEGKVPVVSQGQKLIDGYSNEVEKTIHELPLVMFGDHTRNVKLIDFPFVIGADGTKFFKPILCNPKYIYYVVFYISSKLRNRGYARHYSLLKDEVFPLPPLAEQKRIVAKIEQLMKEIDKLKV